MTIQQIIAAEQDRVRRDVAAQVAALAAQRALYTPAPAPVVPGGVPPGTIADYFPPLPVVTTTPVAWEANEVPVGGTFMPDQAFLNQSLLPAQPLGQLEDDWFEVEYRKFLTDAPDPKAEGSLFENAGRASGKARKKKRGKKTGRKKVSPRGVAKKSPAKKNAVAKMRRRAPSKKAQSKKKKPKKTLSFPL